MRFPRFIPAILLLMTTGCADPLGGPPGRSLEISVAPLNLPGLSKVCYDLRTTNGPDATGAVVFAKGNPSVEGAADTDSLCSTQFGNGSGGGVTFVGACDATPVIAGDIGRTNSVTVWVDSLYATGGAQIAETGSDGWQDPCPSGCTLNANCQENVDTRIEFNLTILRQANQGFFDIGINFEDIFCSTKIDCKTTAGQPIELLFNPATGQRGTTIVSAFACTAGAGVGVNTVLYRDSLKLTCGGAVTELFADTGKGNAWSTSSPDPAPADAVWQYAVYADDEALTCNGQTCNKRFWNVAIGLDPTVDNCTLTTSMTASAGDLTNFTTPPSTTYPIITVNVPITDTAGLVCNKHPLNGSNGVATVYTAVSTAEQFDTDFDGVTFARRMPACNPTCLNGGTCNLAGQCVCPVGWVGPTCSTPASGSFTPPGDQLSTVSMTSAFGLRRLTSSYTGPVVKVRRSSDNTEQDIALTTAGHLDTESLMNFVGSQNSVRQSQTFGVAPWLTQGGNSITSNAVTAPDGTSTAELWTSTSQPAYLYQTFTLPPGPHTLSLYAKAGTTKTIRLDFVTAAFTKGTRATFDLTNSAITQIEHFGGFRGAAAITSEANGWKRISITLTILAPETWYHEITHTTVGNIAVWGAQVNYGASPQTYVATTASAIAGGDGYVTKWYDQSGNARHATPASSASQPRIVSSGAIDLVPERPSIRFDGVDDFLQISSVWPTRIGFATYANRLVGATEGYIIDNSNNINIGGGLSLRFRDNDTLRFWSGDGWLYSATTTSTTPGNRPRIIVAGSSATHNSIHVDGVLDVQVSLGSNTRDEKPITRIGHSEIFGGYLNGQIPEIMTFSDALSGADLAAVHGNMSLYYLPRPFADFDATGYSGSGTSWYASAPHSHASTLTGTPTHLSTTGGAFSFDGDDDKVTTVIDQSYLTADVSVCAWVKPTFSQQAFGRPIVAKSSGCSNAEFVLDYGRAANKFVLVYRDDVVLVSGSSFAENNWHNVCWTRQLSSGTYSNRLYVNGTLSASANVNFGGSSAASSVVAIGHAPACSSIGSWRGDIAQVRVYSSALTALDVASSYAFSRARFGL